MNHSIGYDKLYCNPVGVSNPGDSGVKKYLLRMQSDNPTIHFAICPMCRKIWHDRESFLRDRALVINGYQVNFDRLSYGLFFFSHHMEGCFSTMSMEAIIFYDLNQGERFSERKTLTRECPSYCLYRDNLKPCPASCECAFVRDLIQILQRHKAA